MADKPVKRIAMWSGPRNISTALMRAFENREDCCVVDEPFYGYYLKSTAADHPASEDIIASMDCDWRSVVRQLCEGSPMQDNCSVFYQKHMTQHILPELQMAFTSQLINCFLIRQPRRIIASYARIRPQFTLEELGFPQQLQLFRLEADRLGEAPPVIDSAATLQAPRSSLEVLCKRLGIAYTDRMLRWPRGKRHSDGVWAPYWYASVERSSGFESPAEQRLDTVEIPAIYEGLCDEAEHIYDELYRHALTKAA